MVLSHALVAQNSPTNSWREAGPGPSAHSFFDRTNIALHSVNFLSQGLALWAIQAHDDGGAMARCPQPPCVGALNARGRTLDPLEKHFESYGYGWGAVYRFGGGVGLNLMTAYMLHVTGHHKLERLMPIVAIAHANASLGYALHGSAQGINGW